MLRSFFLLALAASSAFATPISDSTTEVGREITEVARDIPHISINPDPSTIVAKVADVAVTTPAKRRHHMTNAERLARGLPIASPKKLFKPSPRTGAAAPGTSSTPHNTVTGKLAVTYGTGSTGFIGSSFNGFGEYAVTTDPALALVVSIDLDETPGTFTIVGPATAHPPYAFLSGLTGFANTSPNFGKGSYNYAYFGNSNSAPVGPASKQKNTFSDATTIPVTVETALWTVDPVTSAVTATWINTDGTKVPAAIVYANDSNNCVALTGDVGSFQSVFVVPYPELKMTFVPIV